jgi:Protein of unknown function (DUF1761)
VACGAGSAERFPEAGFCGIIPEKQQEGTVMEFLNVLAAGLAAFAFGAVWYMTMSKPWMAAAEIRLGPDGRPANASDKMPFVIGLIGMVLAAGMMRHIFGMTAIDTAGKGLTAGLGIGAFIVLPWVAMNYAFGQRKGMLTVIDGVNIVVGSGLMGLVLMLF